MLVRKMSLMVLAVLLMLAILVWFYPSSGDFEGKNASWNGSSNFLSRFQAIPLSSLSSLPSAPKETTLVTIPYLEFTSVDLEILKEFVAAGGNLVLLDDFGYGNQVLKYLGVQARFSGSLLLDPLFNYKNENFPRTFTFSASLAERDIETVTFNHATCLESIPQENVVAQSSYFSFLDEDQDGEWCEGETKGPLPVIAINEIGEGRLTVIADPSILINDMLDMGDNYLFLEEVCTDTIYLDSSHLPETPLDKAKQWLRGIREWLGTIEGMLVLVMLTLMLTQKHYVGLKFKLLSQGQRRGSD
jgi:hypothetical protein